MIWNRSPTLRTTIGWMMPLARIDCASSCEPRIVDMAARLEVVRLEAIDVDFDRRRARRLRRVRNERAEAFAERGAFFHVIVTLANAEIADVARASALSV